MSAFHSRSIALACAACIGATLVVTASARQAGPGSAASHIDAAKRAAGSDYRPVFTGLCGSLTSPAFGAASGPAPGSTQSAPSTDPPPRSQWHVDPVKVFDNLYYLGQSEYTAWAVTTSAGILSLIHI